MRYFAAARDAAGVADEVLVVDDGATIAVVRAQLLARRPALERVLRQSRLAVDQRFAADDDVVRGREVAVIPPVAGG